MAPSPRTYGQMGLVETTLKRWTDGETHLAVALANPDDAWVRKNRAFLDQALSLCREHVGDLVITGPAGAEVSVGGTPAGTLPAVPALRVAEGTVEVTATASGYEPYKTTVTIRAGKRSALKIAMSAEPVVAGHEDTPPKVPTAVDPEAKPAAEPDTKARRPPPGRAEPLAHVDRYFAGLSSGAGAIAFGIAWWTSTATARTSSRHHRQDAGLRRQQALRHENWRLESRSALGAAAARCRQHHLFHGAVEMISVSRARRVAERALGRRALLKKSAAHTCRGEPRVVGLRPSPAGRPCRRRRSC